MDDLCETFVDTYLQRYRWQLIDRDEFIRLVSNALRSRAEQDAAAVRATILCVYSVTLYQACSGQAGQERWEQGYIELYHFLDGVARYRYPAVRADATQRALEQVYLTYRRCRRPETFLAFVLQKLRDAARAELRALSTERTISHDSTSGDWCLEALEQPSRTPDPGEVAAFHDFQQQLARCSATFLRGHPGATYQFATLWLKYIKGLSDQAISRQLGKSVGAVHVLRSRAIRRLRQEPSWQMLACELGLCQVVTCGY